jgi:hypothetical protein
METAVNMQVVGASMDHIQALRDLLEPLVGQVPAMSSRLELTLGGDRTVITVSDDTITVMSEGKLFQGDWELAQAALAGFPQTPEG